MKRAEDQEHKKYSQCRNHIDVKANFEVKNLVDVNQVVQLAETEVRTRAGRKATRRALYSLLLEPLLTGHGSFAPLTCLKIHYCVLVSEY